MRRLLDMGMEHLNELISKMGEIAEKAVEKARRIVEGEKNGLKEMSNEMKKLRNEIVDIVTEMFIRYSPVASDLRFLQSAIDVSYDLYRISRYAMEIERTSAVLAHEQPIPEIEEAFDIVIDGVKLAVEAFTNRDRSKAIRIMQLDDEMDRIYFSSLMAMRNEEKCGGVKALILRHLERISDHAKEIGEKVIYMIDGRRLH